MFKTFSVKDEYLKGPRSDSSWGLLKKNKYERQYKLSSLRESIQIKSATMTPSAKDDLEAQYERELKEYERYVQDAKDEMREAEAKLLNPWSKELDDIIKSYSEKDGIDLVLEKAKQSIIYSSNKIDITDQIMDIFNKRYKEKSDKAKAKKE